MSLPVIQWDFKPISKPGLYAGIPINAYHGDLCVGPSVSSSGLRTLFWKSAKHFFATSYLNPHREVEDPSEAFVFGRGAHHLLLGESDFRKHFVIRPEKYPEDTDYGHPPPMRMKMKPWSGNAKWCKAWALDQTQHGLTILTVNDIKAIRGMAESLSQDPMIRAGALNGLIEHSFVWQDEATGVWLKWRPDAIPTDSLNFTDLKSTADMTAMGIQRSLDNYSYNQQASLGAEACRKVLGREMADFTLVLCEKMIPHCVALKTILPADISLGIDQNAAALKLFTRCLETGEWTGPGGNQTDAEYVGMSPRAVARAMDRIAEIERQLA